MKAILLIIIFFVSENLIADVVKLSRSGICHDESSRSYSRTKNFESFTMLDDCLKAGGRLPKGHTGGVPFSDGSYSRDKFEHWSDNDSDCINTRHELLMQLSTSIVDTGGNKCTADRGRWLDSYTGKIFYNARELDIDHLVPLYWAWNHGADTWSDDKREQFANDESNLFAVQASVNRSKGALEWLPPDVGFHCQYVTRFRRIILKYGLELTDQEKQGIKELQGKKCKG